MALAIIIILLLSSRGLLAQAAIIEKTEIDLDKKIKIYGSCQDGGLNVRIFSATSSQPFYTAGVDCDANKFEFKDDLGYWKIPDGDYSISIIGKDDNLVNSSTAMFKIESAAPPVSDANIIEPSADLASSSVSVAEETPDQAEIIESPSSGLFAQIINFLVEWFKSAVVMIKELVVEKVSTPELCLGNTCIIEDQLKDLLGGKQKNETVEILAPVSSSTIDVTTTPVN